MLDILQSIPVLSFLPGVMLAMMALFPTRQLGVELGRILLIFTGRGVEHGVQFLYLAEKHSAGAEGSGDHLPLSAAGSDSCSWICRSHHRAGVELDDVGGERMVFPDGLRNVRVGEQGFPVAGAGIVFANGGGSTETRARCCGAWR